jgi:pyrroline-5-carboxylate reductase
MNQNFSQLNLMLVGCGAMGSALLRAWLPDQALFKSIEVITPHREAVAPFLDDARVKWLSQPDASEVSPDIILFAVKPQVLPSILPLYVRFMQSNPLVLTVVAGIARSAYEAVLPQVKLIRIMPNLPVMVLKGMSALCANAQATLPHYKLAEHLMQQVGQVIWVDTDEEIDLVTAVSGCGPAYVYLLSEALEKGAVQLGLDPAKATILARQTIIGAASYLDFSGKTAAELRQQVTSPGGMTEAAVASLQQNGQFDKILVEALKAAMQRAVDLRGSHDDKKG